MLKSLTESFIIAFSMYSRIPMPKVEWTEKGMRYSMCFFPFVGAVIGAAVCLLFRGMDYLHFGRNAIAAGLTVLPILLNGGIHMDGFLDTVDAGHSYKPREEKLAILKDPHAGAFAIIYGGVYFLIMFGLFGEVTWEQLPVIGAGYFYSRTLSALSVVSFPKAKKDGSAAAFAGAAEAGVRNILLLELAACMAVFLLLDPLYGTVCIVAGLLVFWYYYLMSRRVFGGITGDLAGFFLQLAELGMLFSAVMAGKLTGL